MLFFIIYYYIFIFTTIIIYNKTLLLEELMCECIIMLARRPYFLVHAHSKHPLQTYRQHNELQMANLTSDFDYNAALAANTTAAGSPVGSLVRIRVVSAKGLKNKEQFGGIPDPYCEFR